MPMNYSLVTEPFDCWGFDFMGPFPPSHKYTHILVVVDYVTKWVEAIPTVLGNVVEIKTFVPMNQDPKIIQERWHTRFRPLLTNDCSGRRVGDISRRNEMPMNYSLVIKPFDAGVLILWVLFLLRTSTHTS